MTNNLLDQILEGMRKVNGTPLEPVRNGAIWLARVVTDRLYAAQKVVNGSRGLHPLSKVIAEHVGDPFAHWDVTDIPRFRDEFEDLLTYLPHKVSSAVADRTVNTGTLKVKIRCFTPPLVDDEEPILFLHGGGFVLGSYASNDPECDTLAVQLRRRVISIDYPLSPECKFPAVLDVVHTAISSSEVSGDQKFVLMGESAGANLVLSVLRQSSPLRARCSGVILAYPFLDLTLQGASVEKFSEGYFLTEKLLEWFVKCYLPVDVSPSDVRVSPLRAKEHLLPPTLAIVGRYDPLLSDAETLTEQSASVKLVVYDGMLHGFLQMRGLSSARDDALRRIVEFARSL